MGDEQNDTPAGTEDLGDTLAPGTAFGKYVIVRRIGSGGMGAVYEGTHTELGKRVAIKTLHTEVARNAEARARFLREGQVATRIRHPHVVDISDVGVSNGIPYLVMEFLAGEDLAALIGREGALPLERVAEIMLPVLSAVTAAHEEGVVHRDLKPQNIFLARTRHGVVQPKLLDFGISKIADSKDVNALTGTHALLGTPYYMSPEQASGAKNVDARSDQYALGVILYECVTGVRPFQAGTLFALLSSIVQGTFDPPRMRRPELPRTLAEAIVRAMHRDPPRRFENLSALGRELLPYASVLVRSTWEAAFEGADVPAVPASPIAPNAPSLATSAPSFFTGSTLSASAKEVETPKAEPARRPPWAVIVVSVALVAVGVIAGSAWSSRAHVASSPTHAASVPTMPPPVHVEPAPTTPPPVTPLPAPPAALVVPAVASQAAAPPVIAPRPPVRPPTTPMNRPASHARPPVTPPQGSGASVGVNGAPVFE